MIHVHHLADSRSQRILWLLEELGLDYEVVRYEREFPDDETTPGNWVETPDSYAIGYAPLGILFFASQSVGWPRHPSSATFDTSDSKPGPPRMIAGSVFGKKKSRSKRAGALRI